jgi:hypothetical protein
MQTLAHPSHRPPAVGFEQDELAVQQCEDRPAATRKHYIAGTLTRVQSLTFVA